MTTTPIAAPTAADPAHKARARPGEGGGGAFSSVLKLKLGMGLKTAMPPAQSTRPAEAKTADRPAEPAPRRDARRPGRPETPEAREPRESPEPADAPAARPAARDDEPTAPRGPTAPRPVDEPGEQHEAAAEAPRPAAQPADDAQAATPASTEPAADAEPKPQPESQPVAASAPPAEPATAAPALAAAAEHAAATGAGKIDPTGRRPVAAGVRSVQAGKPAEAQAGDEPTDAPRGPQTPGARRGDAPAPEPAAPPTQARDPLGLIRTPVETPRAEPAPAPVRAEPAADRARFADAPAASAPNQTTTGPSAGVVLPGAMFTGQAPAAGAGSKPIGAVGGATAVGSGGGAGGPGAGGGAGGGSGDPAGLLAGRSFGVGAGVFALGRTRAAAAPGGAAEPGKAVQAQISQALAAVLNQKGGVMTLRLNPEHLGSMKIDLEIEGGKVTALFDAQNEQTRQILRDGLDGLKRSIEQAGLTIHRIEVVNAPAAPASHDQPQHQPGQQPTGGRDAPDGGSGGWNGPPRDRSPRDEGPAGSEPTLDEAPAPAVWAERDGSAQGLLRLRVDALI